MTPRRRYPPEPLSRPEIESILTACGESPTGLRNRCLLTLLWRCGLRCREALRLEVRDVAGGLVRVRFPKGVGRGKQPRVLGLDAIAAIGVERWLERRSGLAVPPDAPLLCTLRGRPLQTAYVRELLPRLARRAGIARRVHAHGLRHTFAFECALEGRPMPWIARALGHSSTRVTARYLDHLAPIDVTEAMQERA